MEDPRSKARIRIRHIEDINEVFRLASTRRRDDRDRHTLLHLRDQGRIEACVLPVHVDTIQQDLPGTERLTSLDDSHVKQRPRTATITQQFHL